MFRKKVNSSAIDLLEKHEQILAHECLRHSNEIGALSRALRKNWQKKIQQEVSFIIGVTRGREALSKAIGDLKKKKLPESLDRTVPRYQISSLFLKDCWEYLVSDQGLNERLHLVTGTITAEETRVLSRMEKVRYSKQSSVYVSADKNDSHQKITSLAEDHGHLILGAFHSHISRGMLTTVPSAIDRSLLERMDKIGCQCLGGIFSLDGYVRFFTTNENFKIEIYGKGINKVKENSSYKIFKIDGQKKHGRKNI